MSHIHEALKMAQKEKDFLSMKYGAVLAARGKGRRGPGRRAILGATGLIGFILLAFAGYSWLNFSPKGHQATAQKGGQARIPILAPAKVAQAGASYARARNLHQKGNLAEAKKAYLETLEKDPGHVDALINLGVLYLYDRDFPAAQASFEKAIRLRPESADPFYNMACLFALKGQTEDGLAYLEKAYSLNPSVREWARRDGDLDSLRKFPEFERIFINAPPRGKGTETAPSRARNSGLPEG